MSWLEGLNPEQKSAVLHNQGPLLCLAGAGSGKTTVLVSRTGRLIAENHVSSKEVCVLTFTNKAARELKTRVAARLGPAGRDVWAGTFHSFGLLILRQFYREAKLPKNFGIIDSSDSQGILKELLRDLNLAGKADFDSAKLSSMMSTWRERHRSLALNIEDPYEEALEWLIPRYNKRINALGVVDFDALLLKPLELFEEKPEILERVQSAFKQVMVDEFQDTNMTQLRLVQKIVDPHKNIVVVGDDDQSIYGWRGACVENILNFPNLYEKCAVVRLERNYRSTPAILNLANSVIAKNEMRHTKVLKSDPRAELGELPELFVYENEEMEVEQVVNEIMQMQQAGRPLKDFAILYRSNGQGGLLEAELRRHKVKHSISGGTGFFERKEIKDVLAYLRCGIQAHEVAFRRVLNTPHRGIGETSIDHIAKFAETHGISFIEAARRWNEAEINDNTGFAINTLLEIIAGLPKRILEGADTPGKELLGFLREIGYRHHLEKLAKTPLVAAQKWALIEIAAQIFDKYVAKGERNKKTLRQFLDCMELRDDDMESDKEEEGVRLMTFHACKGLEFPVVFMVGLEEEMIPHRTLGTNVSEERRLFYVGATRAKERLIMTHARSRKRHGKVAASAPSRFVLEIPKTLYREYETGYRPVNSDQRKQLLADLYKKLEEQHGPI